MQPFCRFLATHSPHSSPIPSPPLLHTVHPDLKPTPLPAQTHLRQRFGLVWPLFQNKVAAFSTENAKKGVSHDLLALQQGVLGGCASGAASEC